MQTSSQHDRIAIDKERRSVPLIVIKRKLRRPKTVSEILVNAQKFRDPSHASEKPRNPLEFVKVSYAKALRSKPLWNSIPITVIHLRSLFGEPTRILANQTIEWVVKLKTKEVLKIEWAQGKSSIHGFNKTESIEVWVNRLLNS